MKFDRRSVRSWLIFTAMAASVAIATLLARLLAVVRWPRPRRRRLVMFSHLPSGNVQVFAERMPPAFRDQWEVAFLFVDPRRYGRGIEPFVRSRLALNPVHMLWVARSDVVMCTHGPGLLAPMSRWLPDVHFVDVWHGIGYMDRRPYVEKMSRFDLVLQPSDWTADVIAGLGFPRENIRVTGHAIWDVVLDTSTRARALGELGLLDDRPNVLVAPTWTHGKLWEQRPALSTSWDDLVPELDRWAGRAGVRVLFRSHLNAGRGPTQRLDHVVSIPFSEFPSTADVLAATDVLVTDWSSISSDFLPTGRPIVYLDVDPPFAIGHLDALDRPGPRAASVSELFAALDAAVQHPEEHRREFAIERSRVEAKVCGSSADGRVVDRYAEALDRLVPRR